MAPRHGRNFLLNLVGNLAPLAAALLAVPLLLELAGVERLGVLALIWTVTGYLSLLDLGLGRVFVRRFARADTAADLQREAALLRRVCLGAGLLALGTGALLALALPFAHWLGPDSALAPELPAAVWAVALTLPAVIVTSLLRGALEGRMRFGASNALKLVFGALTFLAPALAALVTPSLGAMAAGIAVVRVLGLLAHVHQAAPMIWPAAWSTARAGAGELGPALREGGWITVTNVVSPLMVSFDRFAVGALVSLAAVSHYSVPQEAVLKLLLVPLALATALYPVLARGEAADPAGSAARRRLGARSMDSVVSVALPLALGMALVAEPALALWLGRDFAAQAATPAAVLAVGMLAMSVAQVPYAALQARGRADLTGKLHLIELPLFAVAVWWLTERLGIAGTAVAWALRSVGDLAAVLWLAMREQLLPPAGAATMRIGAAVALAAAAAALRAADGPAWALLALLVPSALLAAAAARAAWRSRGAGELA
ncbi:MAG: oligosaccharide flippase family protein [Betaproteobacteria bacterium]